MKKYFEIFVLVLFVGITALSSCGVHEGGVASVSGSFYVDNPWDSTKNNLQAFADTVYHFGQFFLIDTITPVDSVDAQVGTIFINKEIPTIYIKTAAGAGNWDSLAVQ